MGAGPTLWPGKGPISCSPHLLARYLHLKQWSLMTLATFPAYTIQTLALDLMIMLFAPP